MKLNWSQRLDNYQKRATARVYESAVAEGVLERSLHPGGVGLTASAARAAGIKPDSRVLNVACGSGESDCFLAREYNCWLVGIDLSGDFIAVAKSKVEAEGVSAKVDFLTGDGENLPFRGSTFDAIIIECAFSLLPNKELAAREFRRVLRPAGKLVVTDVILRGQLSEELRTTEAACLCMAGARSLEEYIRILEGAGFTAPYTEEHDREFREMVFRIVYRCGPVENFCLTLSRKSGTDSEMDVASTAELWRRLFREGKPSYALIAMTRP